MQLQFSPFVIKEIKKIKQKDKKLAEKIEKQLLTFKFNPQHPSLRVHKLTGKKENAWSISITISIRMVYIIISKEVAYFIDIGSHDQVYKK